MGTIIGVGNCQLHGMLAGASAVLGLTPVYLHPHEFDADPRVLLKLAGDAEVVFAQRAFRMRKIRKMLPSSNRPTLPVIEVPRLYFGGFHPDFTTPLKAAGRSPHLPLGTANSAILLQAWRDGLSVDDAVGLFRDAVFETLGYYEAYDAAVDLLADECARCGIDVRPLIRKWMKTGPFFYVPLHPRVRVLGDIAVELLRNAGLYSGKVDAWMLKDKLFENVIWPVYPDIAARLGVAGDYIFKPKQWRRGGPETAPMDLREFVERTFAGYRQTPPDFSFFPRMDDPRLQSLRSFVGGRPAYEEAFGSTDWMEEEADAGKNVICDEELLDDSADEMPGGAQKP